MRLRRTSSALHSLHRFFQVDIVVYCEGGPPLDYNSAVARSRGNQSTHDVLFWTAIIQRLGLNKKYHFKSVGSKATLESICDDIEDGQISSITVCRDRDYDGLLNRLHPSGRVCYSRGYSWENDAISLPVVEAIVRDFIGVGRQQDDEVSTLRERLSEFQRILNHWVEIDISMYRLGKTCVFHRKNPNASLDFSCHPNLRVAELQKVLSDAGYKRKPKRCVSISCDDTLSVCFGKLVSHAIYHYVGDIFSKYGIRKLDYDHFMRLAISRTAQMFDSTDLSSVSANFRSQVSALK